MTVPCLPTGCPNLASCAFCTCRLRVTEDDTSYLLADLVPGFSYAARVSYPLEVTLSIASKPDPKKHAKQLMKLQKKRF